MGNGAPKSKALKARKAREEDQRVKSGKEGAAENQELGPALCVQAKTCQEVVTEGS